MLDESSAQALNRYLEWAGLQGLSDRTIYCRRTALTRFGHSLPAGLLQATPEQLRTWRAGLTYSDGTIATYVTHLRVFYAWALDEGLVPSNPMRRIPSPRLGRRLPRPIGEDDLMEAVHEAPARIRPWFVLAAWCGLRAKEIALLRRENVLDQLVDPVIVVVKDATKGRRERLMPACPFVISELRRAGLPRIGWVFPRYDGQPGPNKPHNVSMLCNTWLESCGIDATLHQLRHWYGTAMYRETRDLRLVQELMGHGDPGTTAGYAAYSDAEAAAAAARLPVPPMLRALADPGAAAENA